MLLGRWIGRSLRGDLEIVFLFYWVIRDTLCRKGAEQRGREKGKKPPIVSVSRTTMEGFAFKVVNLEALIKSYRHRWLKLFIFNQCDCKATFKKPF